MPQNSTHDGAAASPAEWTLQSEAHEFGHTMRIYQCDYIIVMQIDDLCMVGYADERGSFVLPRRLPIIHDLDAAKQLCELMLLDSEVW